MSAQKLDSRADRSLKATVVVLSLSLSSGSMMGCTESTALEHTSESQPSAQASIPSWEAYRAAAKREGNGFVVEWDIWVPSEDALRAYYEQTVLELTDKAHIATQYSTGARLIWSAEKATNIRYCVSHADFDAVDGTYYERALDELEIAMRDWEDQANVNFNHVPAEDDDCHNENAHIDIAIGPMPVGGGYTGCAAFPMYNWEGEHSSIGPCHMENFLGIDFAQADLSMEYTSVGVLRHELGHALGFRHEHPWRGPQHYCGEYQSYITAMPEDVSGEAVTGVTYDEESVMHYRGSTCAAQGGFGPTGEFVLSKNDGESARAVYGMPVSWYVAIL